MLFKEKLKILRGYSGVSQEELAVLLGVSTATISRIERGEQQPSFSLVAELIQVLRVSPEFLLLNEQVVTADNSQDMDAKLALLDSRYAELNAEDKKLFDDMLNLLIQGAAYGLGST